jgi:hypothetical protein
MPNEKCFDIGNCLYENVFIIKLIIVSLSRYYFFYFTKLSNAQNNKKINYNKGIIILSQ